MHRTVAGAAVRRIRIARCGRLPVDALPKIFHFVGMTLRALGWCSLGRSRHFVRIAVAGLASSYADRTMNAARHVRSFVAVAGRALHLRHFVSMRKIPDAGVAIGAAQNAVDTGRVLGRINRDAFASGRSRSRLAVAAETAFVLLEWMGRFRLRLKPARKQSADRKQHDETAKM